MIAFYNVNFCCDQLTKNVSKGIMAQKLVTQILGIPSKKCTLVKLSAPFEGNSNKCFSGNFERGIDYHFDAVIPDILVNLPFIGYKPFLDLVAGEHYKSSIIFSINSTFAGETLKFRKFVM